MVVAKCSAGLLSSCQFESKLPSRHLRADGGGARKHVPGRTRYSVANESVYGATVRFRVSRQAPTRGYIRVGMPHLVNTPTLMLNAVAS